MNEELSRRITEIQLFWGNSVHELRKGEALAKWDLIEKGRDHTRYLRYEIEKLSSELAGLNAANKNLQHTITEMTQQMKIMATMVYPDAGKDPKEISAPECTELFTCWSCGAVYEPGTMYFDDMCDECAKNEGYDISGNEKGDGKR